MIRLFRIVSGYWGLGELLVIMAFSAIGADSARADFATVINSPPTTIGSGQSIGSDTQLNVNEGGFVGDFFAAGASDGSSTNIEVNVFGGVVSYSFSAYGGSVVNVFDGDLTDEVTAHDGSEVNVMGGLFGYRFSALSGSVVNVAGGIFGDNFTAEAGSALTLIGNEFLLDGAPVGGLETIGNTTIIALNINNTLTGTLADGTTFTFAPRDSDDIQGSITLQAAALPAIGPTVIDVPTDLAPRSIRSGQTVNLGADGYIPNDFHAGPGSAVNISGGSVADNFEAAGATVEISEGTVGSNFDAFYGSVINILGGEVDGGFAAAAGSSVTISGGAIGNHFEAQSGSQVHLAGGTMGDEFRVLSGSSVTIHGGEFYLNDEPIEVSESPLAIDVPFNSILSGTLADGTPFAFHSQDIDILRDGTITLSPTALPEIGPAVINVPTDAAPLGIRSGQRLVVADGGSVPDNFNAGRGSTVEVTGGTVGSNFEATGGNVIISGGTFADHFDAMPGAVVNISGGSLGSNFDAAPQSIVNISGGTFGTLFRAFSTSNVNIAGGTFGNIFHAYQGSKVHVSGGQLGDNVHVYSDDFNLSGGQTGKTLRVESGGVLNVSGGQIGDNAIAWGGSTLNLAGGQLGESFRAWEGSVVNLSGGTFGDVFGAISGSTIHLFGTEFVLDGIDITDSLTANVPLTIMDRNVSLVGALADGTPFDLFLSSTSSAVQDYVSAGALLTVTLVDFIPGDYNRNGTVDAADYSMWRDALGNSVTVGSGADGNFDGRVTEGDFYVWRAHFGETFGAGAGAAAVPEPGTLAMLFMGSILGLAARRRRFDQEPIPEPSAEKGTGTFCPEDSAK